MTAADRLIKEISEVLTTGKTTGGQQVGTLAGDYAALCHEANLRLAQCSAMIEKGNDYQALQLAETEPNLMDLAGALSFGGAAAWVEYCAKNGLTVPERMDARHVRVLNTLYTKGISANHPLYKDYRAAVSSRDDAKALQIIRTITRVNPTDANAKAELERLLNKLLHARQEELKQALQAGDESATVKLADEIDGMGTPQKLAQFPEWPRAADIRHAVRKREAFEALRAASANTEQLRATGKWREVGTILRSIERLHAEKHFIPQEEEEALLMRMRSFHEAKEEEARREVEFRQALAQLGTQVEETEMRIASRSSTTLHSVQTDYLTLNKRWQDVERFSKPVPEELQARVRRNASILQSETTRLKKQRKTKILAGIAVFVALAGTGAVFAYRAVQSGDYAAQLDRLRTAKQVEPAEKLLASLETSHKDLAGMPGLHSKIAELQLWVKEERRKRTEADAQIAELEGFAAKNFAEIGPMDVQSKIGIAKKNTDALAEDLKPEAEAKLTAVQNKFDASMSTMRAHSQEIMEGSLPGVETAATNELGFDKPVADLKASIQKIEPDLQKLEQLAHPQGEDLKPSATLVARVEAARSKVVAIQKELDKWTAAQDEMQRATTLDAFRKALEKCKDSLLVQAPEIVAARQRLTDFTTPEQVWTAMFIPGDAAGWTAMSADQNVTFIPGEVFPAELEMLLALRDNDNLKNIWELTTVDPSKKDETGVAFSRGNVKQTTSDDKHTTLSGSIYNATKNPAALFFSDTTVVCDVAKLRESIKPAAGTVAMNGLGLNYLIDDSGEKYEKSMLKVMDELVAQDSNPLFKAFIMQRFRDFMNLRPYAWGLQWCPALRRDFATLAKMSTDDPVRSSDWMVPKRNKDAAPQYLMFFKSLGGYSYMKEAATMREMILKAKAAGLTYAGYMGPDGKPRIVAEVADGKEFWAVAGDGKKLAGVKAKDAKGEYETLGEVPAFTPLFRVKVDRNALVEQACKNSGVPPTSDEFQSNLPPFFTVIPR